MKKIWGIILIICGGVLFIQGFSEPFGILLIVFGLGLGVLGLSMFDKKK
jgi:membrane-bound ClpP family serine protease